MKILLTGATGFLGNNLLRLLLEDGHEVSVTVREISDLRALGGLAADRVTCDLENSDEIATVIGDAELVIHSAALIQIGWSRLEQSRSVNVAATQHLARAARLKNIRMIHVSTVDALAAASPDRINNEADTDPPKPLCSYVASKRDAESVFREEVAAGLDGFIVNPGFMVGPWDYKPSSGQMMLAIAKQFTPLAPSGGCSVVDVRDVGCGILSAIENGQAGQSYIMAGENISYFDLWKRMAAIVGSRPPVGTLPTWINWTAGRVGDLVHRVGFSEPVVNSAATTMGSLYHWYSSEKAINELGYQINDVDDALIDAWNWFRQSGYA